ncbi:MAG: dimethylaniline monooxygenase, partial [Gammaproteobacteria bacterium]|nr:dimethylaniline monooxygenase [Gammaproteobacteria bacterium]
AEREALGARFWAEGRLKVEPWLEQRCAAPSIRLWPNTSLRECAVGEDGAMTVSLDDGTILAVDHVTLATGYKVDLARLPFLAAGNLLNRLAMSNGSPVLDTRLQTSIPGLYMTSMAATASFGAFFAFTVSARASAQLIGAALAA